MDFKWLPVGSRFRACMATSSKNKPSQISLENVTNCIQMSRYNRHSFPPIPSICPALQLVSLQWFRLKMFVCSPLWLSLEHSFVSNLCQQHLTTGEANPIVSNELNTCNCLQTQFNINKLRGLQLKLEELKRVWFKFQEQILFDQAMVEFYTGVPNHLMQT